MNLDFLKNIHPCYLILNILIWIVFYIYLRKQKYSKKIKIISMIGCIGISIFSFSYFNGMVETIFELKYLSVKIYLGMLVITNLIILFTINKPVRLGYKITNYILFIMIMMIFGSIAAIVLGNKYESFYIMDVGNAVNFIDLSFVIFLLYLILTCVLYIWYYLFEEKTSIKEEKVVSEARNNKILTKISSFKEKITSKKKEQEVFLQEESSLNLEELLMYDHENGFYIDGVECSIIFDDSNQENIIKNYQILSKDIHARLVNGYTLEENRMLKNICMKLQVNNLSNIDIYNVSLLNKISIEEYNLLRRVFGIY